MRVDMIGVRVYVAGAGCIDAFHFVCWTYCNNLKSFICTNVEPWDLFRRVGS